jgi:60 kDa SS-A/Ro ribonucleoprotein
MAHLRTEANTFVGGFSYNFVDLGITKKDSLKQASDKCIMRDFGSTDPSAAIEYATNRKIPADCFIVITDNEVNSGIHATQALNQFRKTMQIPQAKMIVCGLAANNFTIADPKDPNQLDVAGFSPDLTSVISSFTK